MNNLLSTLDAAYDMVEANGDPPAPEDLEGRGENVLKDFFSDLESLIEDLLAFVRRETDNNDHPAVKITANLREWILQDAADALAIQKMFDDKRQLAQKQDIRIVRFELLGLRPREDDVEGRAHSTASATLVATVYDRLIRFTDQFSGLVAENTPDELRDDTTDELALMADTAAHLRLRKRHDLRIVRAWMRDAAGAHADPLSVAVPREPAPVLVPSVLPLIPFLVPGLLRRRRLRIRIPRRRRFVRRALVPRRLRRGRPRPRRGRIILARPDEDEASQIFFLFSGADGGVSQSHATPFPVALSEEEREVFNRTYGTGEPSADEQQRGRHEFSILADTANAPVGDDRDQWRREVFVDGPLLRLIELIGKSMANAEEQFPGKGMSEQWQESALMLYTLQDDANWLHDQRDVYTVGWKLGFDIEEELKDVAADEDIQRKLDELSRKARADSRLGSIPEQMQRMVARLAQVAERAAEHVGRMTETLPSPSPLEDLSDFSEDEIGALAVFDIGATISLRDTDTRFVKLWNKSRKLRKEKTPSKKNIKKMQTVHKALKKLKKIVEKRLLDFTESAGDPDEINGWVSLRDDIAQEMKNLERTGWITAADKIGAANEIYASDSDDEEFEDIGASALSVQFRKKFKKLKSLSNTLLKKLSKNNVKDARKLNQTLIELGDLQDKVDHRTALIRPPGFVNVSERVRLQKLSKEIGEQIDKIENITGPAVTIAAEATTCTHCGCSHAPGKTCGSPGCGCTPLLEAAGFLVSMDIGNEAFEGIIKKVTKILKKVSSEREKVADEYAELFSPQPGQAIDKNLDKLIDFMEDTIDFIDDIEKLKKKIGKTQQGAAEMLVEAQNELNQHLARGERMLAKLGLYKLKKNTAITKSILKGMRKKPRKPARAPPPPPVRLMLAQHTFEEFEPEATACTHCGCSHAPGKACGSPGCGCTPLLEAAGVLTSMDIGNEPEADAPITSDAAFEEMLISSLVNTKSLEKKIANWRENIRKMTETQDGIKKNTKKLKKLRKKLSKMKTELTKDAKKLNSIIIDFGLLVDNIDFNLGVTPGKIKGGVDDMLDYDSDSSEVDLDEFDIGRKVDVSVPANLFAEKFNAPVLEIIRNVQFLFVDANYMVSFLKNREAQAISKHTHAVIDKMVEKIESLEKGLGNVKTVKGANKSVKGALKLLKAFDGDLKKAREKLAKKSGQDVILARDPDPQIAFVVDAWKNETPGRVGDEFELDIGAEISEKKALKEADKLVIKLNENSKVSSKDEDRLYDIALRLLYVRVGTSGETRDNITRTLENMRWEMDDLMFNRRSGKDDLPSLASLDGVVYDSTQKLADANRALKTWDSQKKSGKKITRRNKQVMARTLVDLTRVSIHQQLVRLTLTKESDISVIKDFETQFRKNAIRPILERLRSEAKKNQLSKIDEIQASPGLGWIELKKWAKSIKSGLDDVEIADHLAHTRTAELVAEAQAGHSMLLLSDVEDHIDTLDVDLDIEEIEIAEQLLDALRSEDDEPSALDALQAEFEAGGLATLVATRRAMRDLRALEAEGVAGAAELRSKIMNKII